MYCGICVEVCPFEAIFWSPEYEYSEPASPTSPRQVPPG
jgi:formate hydrogenlyase subunit 6/NADH:ubiquinone oxidoreductase subunit I